MVMQHLSQVDHVITSADTFMSMRGIQSFSRDLGLKPTHNIPAVVDNVDLTMRLAIKDQCLE